DPSLFVTIRRRLPARTIEAINEIFIQKVREYEQIEAEHKQSRRQSKACKKGGKTSFPLENSDSSSNKGKLIVDATIAPSNIKYPTDLDLLNDSREISEKLIDKLYLKGLFEHKPRTYRQKARQDFLNVIKKKRKSKKALCKGIRKQLQYLRRNLTHLDQMLAVFKDQPDALSEREIELLEVIRKIYAQQKEMYINQRHTVKDRIVSIHQPYIRPMVRGKANAEVEFGAKISVSVVAGYVFLDRLKWDAYNENMDLVDQVNRYRQRFGYYPAVVIADGIYGTRDNRSYLEEHGIRFSGKKLGRPPKEISAIAWEMERLRILEQGERNEVEGKIGTAKTRYGLGKVLARTKETSENWIAMALLSMNMATALRLTAKPARQFLLSLIDIVKKWVKIMVNGKLIATNQEIIPVLT
ncbi:MAG TPA: transposase, partial [Candidatus Marinimicrobia bacterium]|nr:transposase [Candidatus Neomarinimicrobiota bacterium]